MRGYAVAMGIVLTVGYGCVAQMAVRSAGVRHEVRATPGYAPAVAPDTVWCGGTLAPVVVEAPGVARAGPGVPVVTRRWSATWTLTCERPLRRPDRAV